MLQLVNFGSNLFSFSESDWEETHLDEDITQKLGGLLGDRITGQEDIIFLSPLFNFGFIFIESLEAVNIDVGDIVGSCFFNVCSIGEDANLY